MHKILQQLQTNCLAFFGVKLYGKNIIVRQSAGKCIRVLRSRRHYRGIIGLRIITMHKIKAAVLGNIFPERMLVQLMNLIPAHVRDFEGIAVAVC